MANTYVNKVVQSDGTTLMDITDTTAEAADVAEGKYFYLATGERVQGAASTFTNLAPIVVYANIDSYLALS